MIGIVLKNKTEVIKNVITYIRKVETYLPLLFQPFLTGIVHMHKTKEKYI